MNLPVGEVLTSLRGVFALLGFQEDWKRYFNVKPAGLASSFLGAVLGLPAFILLIVFLDHFIAEHPEFASSGLSLGDAFFVWLRFWLLFPVSALLVCWVLNLTQNYAAWLVVHNWTVLLLIHIQTLIWALVIAGLVSIEGLAALYQVYLLGRFLIHWRVAHGVLGLPAEFSIAAAAIPLVIDWGVLRLIQ